MVRTAMCWDQRKARRGKGRRTVWNYAMCHISNPTWIGLKQDSHKELINLPSQERIMELVGFLHHGLSHLHKPNGNLFFLILLVKIYCEGEGQVRYTWISTSQRTWWKVKERRGTPLFGAKSRVWSNNKVTPQSFSPLTRKNTRNKWATIYYAYWKS